VLLQNVKVSVFQSTDGNDHPAAIPQLFDKRLGDLIWGAGHDNGIEWLLGVSLAKPTSAPLRFRWLRKMRPRFWLLRYQERKKDAWKECNRRLYNYYQALAPRLADQGGVTVTHRDQALAPKTWFGVQTSATFTGRQYR
jgi:hypothetical protein